MTLPDKILTGRHTGLRVLPDGSAATTVADQDCVVVWRLSQQGVQAESVTKLGTPINDISLAPDGSSIVVALRSGPPKVCSWKLEPEKDLKLRGEFQVESLAHSPCGQFLAMATSFQSVLFYDLERDAVCHELDGGERTLALAFSPDNAWFAWSLSHQGGVSVGIARREGDDLKPARGVQLSAMDTPPEEFADTVPTLAFSADSRCLAVWETSHIYQERRPPGWRGDLMLFQVESRRIMGGLKLQPEWQLSLDARLTRDETSDSGMEMSTPAQLAFFDNDRRLALGLSDQLLVLDPGNGALLSHARTQALGLAARGSGLVVAGQGVALETGFCSVQGK